MVDKISIDRAKKLHPRVREEVIYILGLVDQALTGRAKVRIVQGYRTFPDQQAIYSQGRTKPGAIVTNAAAGESLHNYGLAVDFCLILDGKEVSWDTLKDFDGDKKADWMEVVDIFRANGWTWGADWDGDGVTKAQGDKDEHLVDAPHFQKTFGYGWRDLLALHKLKKVDDEGYVIIT